MYAAITFNAPPLLSKSRFLNRLLPLSPPQPAAASSPTISPSNTRQQAGFQTAAASFRTPQRE